MALIQSRLVGPDRRVTRPILLGDGHRPFAAPPSTSLALEETRTFGSGVVMLRYTRRQEPPR